MRDIRNLCVYCGSAAGGDPRFSAEAQEFGRILARAGVGLVFGGGNCGLMGAIARATLEAGGRVTGVIPGFLEEREITLGGMSETIVVDNMHTRKQIMFERSDAFVALPGGIGTLEELAEQLTWIQLGRHAKPLVIADIGGFWRPLLNLFAHMRNSGFLRPGADVHYMVAERIEDVLPMILTAARHLPQAQETDVTERM